MRDNKKTGSYYTPPDVIRFMVEYLSVNGQNFSKVLEPSAGDGRFIFELESIADSITVIEKFDEKVKLIRNLYPLENVKVLQDDFLDYATSSNEKYTLIIGNPPYINMKNMSTKDIDKARSLCIQQGVKKGIMQNLWVAFVLGASKMLYPDGSLFFVLPTEFLQVQYAETLRENLEKDFNVIHIISFCDAVFPDIEQDVCLVYLTNRKEEEAQILYRIYKNATTGKLIKETRIKKNKPLKKWSNAILGDEEISLLKAASEMYTKIDKIGTIAPGIVTGGNKYFILTQSQVQQYRCDDFVLPIIQKSSYIEENTIEITIDMFSRICENGKPAFVLNLSNVSEKNIPLELMKYLNEVGDKEENDVKLKERFKCANRSPWYGVPIVNKGDIVFFKRYGKLPRIYTNRNLLHTTDAGYHIRLNKEYDVDSVLFCFFNSMTLAHCEFNGRYYGGGVCELVPSEFKAVPIPYRLINKAEVDKLKMMFRQNVSTEEIVKYVNSKTIAGDFPERIEMFERIHKQLVGRRKQ